MLPTPFDAEDAADIWQEDITDAARAYLVNFLFDSESLTNKQIRHLLKIDHVYKVTHLKMAGSLTEEELLLWDKNPRKITLSHIRAIAKLQESHRKKLIRELLVKNISSRKLEVLARNIKLGIPNQEEDVDIQNYAELVSEQIGRPISIKFDSSKRVGEIALKFFSIDDLANITEILGYKGTEEF